MDGKEDFLPRFCDVGNEDVCLQFIFLVPRLQGKQKSERDKTKNVPKFIFMLPLSVFAKVSYFRDREFYPLFGTFFVSIIPTSLGRGETPLLLPSLSLQNLRRSQQTSPKRPDDLSPPPQHRFRTKKKQRKKDTVQQLSLVEIKRYDARGKNRTRQFPPIAKKKGKSISIQSSSCLC